jgi:hypothetical protein
MRLLDLLKPKSEPGKENHLVLLIDYENVGKEVISGKQVVDLSAIRNECLKIGVIDLSVAFAPEHLIYDGLTDYLHDRNYMLIACPSKNKKQKDWVDTIMTEFGKLCANLSIITHIVIVAMDGDFTELANYARDHRKKTIVFASENISSTLREVVDKDKILPLPLKALNLPEDRNLRNLSMAVKNKNGKH